MSTVLLSQSGRCLCNGLSIFYPPGPNGGSTDDCPDHCLQVASIITPCSENVTFNGESFFVPISDFNKYDACEGSYTLSILSFDSDIFTDVFIDGDENITFETQTVAPGGVGTDPFFTTIVYHVKCDQGILSSVGTVRVCINPQL